MEMDVLNLSEVVGLLGEGKGAKFANIVYRVKKNNELAKYRIILGASTEVLYAKDIVKLDELYPTLTAALDKEACKAIRDSREESLTLGVGNNTKYTCADTYVAVMGIPGVRVHKETGCLYVSGLVEEKTILEAGEPYKEVKSKPLTIAKQKIEKTLPSSRFRLLVIERVRRLAANGEVIEIEQEDAEPVTA
jgi:hypothetical protein